MRPARLATALPLLAVLAAGGDMAAKAQSPEPLPDAAASTPTELESALQKKRDDTRAELEALSQTMTLSTDKVKALEDGIAALDKSSASLREALIESAARRKSIDKDIARGESRLAELQVRSDMIHGSLRERRGLLAEVLAALQRMGRNPPPALLVTPEDALASVRSAILLGAVVPGIRRETEKLAADLDELTTLSAHIRTEKETLTAAIASSMEEERRMDLLIVENDKASRRSAGELDAERRRTEELAARATSLESLIGSLETEITSARDAATAARVEEERRRLMSDEQRQKARELAESGVPDKNRIAPAYAFSDLKKKLELPVAGTILRQFGDADGTGHPARGMTVAVEPGALVTAPADGSVVFAGAFRSYGQMIILNTGDGYHLVMAGMDQVKTRQGKFVFAGEPLAVMGEKRVASATALALETDRPTLYIEFRKDGAPVDSRPWWTATSSGKARNDT
ncbi:murein hydrolase activator EnvC [Rhizobium sp. YJ-22]|uniref:murein hydrolase activator EnvC family protein n=1 Tax=Rhizobium sp. YJ-22 TaxID=3037556 RepID=UPI002412AD62|nr:murein hydrolase activator EnvC [Rhizobium sp. YJ-22]MDG3577587.1 murein hydrolase activator EnvC [Rhizobium sp. YJ-22]